LGEISHKKGYKGERYLGQKRELEGRVMKERRVLH
jgi:hypothetical protein